MGKEPAFRRRAIDRQIQLQNSSKIIFHSLDAACAFVSRAIHLAVGIAVGIGLGMARRQRIVSDRGRSR